MFSELLFEMFYGTTLLTILEIGIDIFEKEIRIVDIEITSELVLLGLLFSPLFLVSFFYRKFMAYR